MYKALVVNKLSKIYGKTIAVNNISFEINHNEIFALVGPNGAGKSTMLKMAATVLKPTSGNLSIYDNDITKSPTEIRKIISYLPEEAGAYTNMSGQSYLKFIASIYSDKKSDQNDFIQRGKEISNLKDKLKNKIKTYSKGMTRKLLLARAVMNSPKLAILDEPTSGLDVVNSIEIREIIKNLSKEGMAVLLSSHNMLEIEFLSDRVGIIDNGKIKTIGTPNQLKRKYESNNLEEVFIKIAS